ncbi:CTR copper uptake transporter [Mycena alexandri]|uniref:Copper transport protein n=1 Tax=Mycena alexandri TaxID=1745969 RepID=A0AAD6T2C5_9AGAR|nr:CTR copper uptake transporter [Mycena alexandri]
MSLTPLVLLSLFPWVYAAAENGMDMSMDDGMTLAAGTMMPMLHFTRGDTLWFMGWVPQTAGAMAGACIGLFILTLIDRWLAAVRAMMELYWRETGLRLRQKSAADVDDKYGKIRRLRLRAPPFIPAHDIMRGAMHALQAALGFAFMLAIMTFQAAYIITIALGLGIGEMLFGRYSAGATGH